MRRFLVLLVLLSAVAGTVSACVVEPVPPGRPGAVWVRGHYNYGRWVPGHWA